MGWLTDYIDDMIADDKRRFDQAIEDAKKEFFDLEQKKVKKMYEEVIQNFYSSYNRKYYVPRESLYHLLECTTDYKRLIMDFKPEMITSRNGYAGEDGLYKTVFKEGWHGGSGKTGAKSYPFKSYNEGEYVAYNGDPEPYSEKPYYWIPAKRAEKSPLDDFTEKWNKFQDTEFEDDANRIFNKHFDKI